MFSSLAISTTKNHSFLSDLLKDPVSIVCVSDTHGSLPALPDGDVLIHAGDLTQSGSLKELQVAIAWLREQTHAIKIVVAGNHDLLLDAGCDRGSEAHAAADRQSLDWGDIIYLENEGTVITCGNGRRVYGSPCSARHGNWAFQYPRSKDIWSKRVPDGIDILITHGPPRGHLDLLDLGCVHLLKELCRVQPRLHVFGHIHEGAGTEWLDFSGLQAAYDRTAVAGGGLWNLMQTAAASVLACFAPSIEAKCLLVNPSIVGGLRDDTRRWPIVVEI